MNLYQQIASLSPEQRALFEQRLKQRGIQPPETLSIPKRHPSEPIPLSFAQQRLWFIQQLDPTNAAYNVPSALRIRGDLNVAALARSLNALVRRHEILRTTFTTIDNQAVQSIAPFQPFDLPIVDLRHVSARESEVQRLALAAAEQPFDLSRSLLRLALLQLQPTDHVLLITVHHIVSDRWSVGIFLRELSALYNADVQGQPLPLAEMPIQYADWAIWQRRSLQGDRLDAQIDYWKDQLLDLTALDLPVDRPRPAQPSYQGGQHPIALDRSLSDRLKALSAKEGITLFTLLLAAFQTLLHRYTQQDDIAVGTDIANRDRAETAGLIGLLVNTLVLRTDLSGNPSFRELLGRVRQVMKDAIAHQDLPFEKLVEVLNPDRDLSQMMPLFQAKLDLQLASVKPLELANLTIDRLPYENETAKYELRFNLQDSETGISGQIEYSADLFTAQAIARLATHFQTLLESIVDDFDRPLSELQILTSAEQKKLLEWNQTERDYPVDRTIHSLFEAQVKQTPDAIALRFDHQQFTYQELNAKANQLAHFLQQQNLRNGEPIGIWLDRSPNLIIGLLAILKAGCAYVPLDSSYPIDRLKFVLADAQVKILLTQSQIIADLALDSVQEICVDVEWEAIDQCRQENPIDRTLPDQLAYIIYTSGSTGIPKGVAIAHHNTITFLHWAKEIFAEAITGVLAATSVCFDLSVFEIFAPLSFGGTIVLAENILALPDLPAANHVTLINTVPSAIAELLRSRSIPKNVCTVNLAGEALPSAIVQQLYSLPQIQQVFNLYGPSEDTTYSTVAPLEKTDSVSIGRPIANTQAYVLDRHLQPVAIGVAGELYLSGAGLAQGYFDRPDLTAERFIPNPFKPGTRLYKTGDRVRRLSNGAIEYLGRLDHQVKIRGFRIELGEIEVALLRHPDVEQAIAIVQSARLVAFVVGSAAVAQLRDDLRAQLPAYMLPAAIVTLEALPRLPNGKIDRAKLTKDGWHPIAETAFVAPETELEQAIASIWQQELRVDRVGRLDNFFELGGHSLLGLSVMARIREATQAELPLRSLFEAPTVAGLAAQVESGSRIEEASQPAIAPDVDRRFEPFPLTDIQQAYWIGRNSAFELGNVATHGYREIETIGLSVAGVEWALHQLIDRHEMLRSIVQPDGQQRILPTVPPYEIQTIDLRGQSPESVEAHLLELRDRLSHQVLPTDRFPLFDIQAVRLDEEKIRFCISFDVLIGDAWSFQILGRELAQLLQFPDAALPALNLSFRDYVLAERAWHNSPQHDRSIAYWQDRLPTLPPAPELPLIQHPGAIETPRFVRRSGTLRPESWQRLKQTAAQANVTPSGVLLAAFAEILANWSKQPAFTLNLTLFNRLPLHPEVNQLVGDFTSSTLLAIDSAANSFTQRAQQIQAQLWQDLDHRDVSGVEVLRQLARSQQRITSALMPVVFTSVLLSEQKSDRLPWQSEVVYSLSQTSQVYLDHQVAEVDRALVFNWDAIDDLFPSGVLNEMFAAYDRLLDRLADDPACWSATSLISPSVNWSANATETEFPDTLLHTLVFDRITTQPDRIAVIAPQRSLTYRELGDRALRLASHLHRQGIRPNQLVAVVMQKGWEQIVAVLGVLAAGAAYVPIDPDLPIDRLHHLLAQAKFVLTQSWLDLQTDLPRLSVDTAELEEAIDLPTPATTDLAYVIYTSGSTGLPKGVMIEHRSAVNTILDINQRFDVAAGDRVLALSSLSFDLSVYDIFGILAAGGAIVLPDPTLGNDPAHWQHLIAQHRVTVWNSVPALMQLLVEQSIDFDLRLVMLSGDWIPLNLPDRIRDRFPNAEIISLGGATEAAIWSIFHAIDRPEPNWNSIPYGRPLANQQFYVLNSRLEPCPAWVTGELYIGGKGLARGYWGDRAKTEASFITHPQFGRLYKTGDLGRWRDGSIELLGRADFQVKVNGYRIELGEIETVLQQHPAIQTAIVTAIDNSLAAYIVPQPVDRVERKLSQANLRQSRPDEVSIALPTPSGSIDLRRQSYRQFLPDSIDLTQLSNLLGNLRQHQIDHAPLPKYRYASAGSLYPVQTYVLIRGERVTRLEAGVYYYHPADHCLVWLDAAPELDYGSNRSIFEQSAFSLFLVGQLAAIAPVYGDKAKDFCLLEAGYMSQLLMETAPDFDLGLCPIGALPFEPLQQAMQLEPSHILLHSLVGGAIDPAWTTQWNPPAPAPILDQIREFLRQKLPAYMIPSRFQFLEALPLTANGKLDRLSLPQFAPDRPAESIAPQTEIERAIAQIWQQALQVEAIGIHDDFFELGGNSLSATQVITQMRQTFQAEVPIRQFFTAPTIAAQAQMLRPVEAIAPIPKVERSPDIDRLSDQEVDALLNQLLAEEGQ